MSTVPVPPSLPPGRSLASLPTDHAEAIRSLVASAWHGVWQLALSTPWVAIGVMVPAVALLVTCTRLSLHRG